MRLPTERDTGAIPMDDCPLLFDVDGVIVRHHRAGPTVYTKAIDEAFAEFDVSLTAEERQSFVGDVSPERMRSICRTYGLDLPTLWPVREQAVSAAQQALCRAGERVLFDDVRALSKLAGSHPIAFVSNNQHATIEFMLDHFGLESLVDTAYGREPTWDGFERRKPDPYYIEQAMTDLECDGGLYVGDRATDIEAARRAGLEAVYLDRTQSQPTAPSPDATIQSLTALPSVIDRL
ncbi:HAD-IA family hydrolase [Natronorubrum sp. JWXQ-INN-674]|uniref:HAD-IA family hydrolase n=1 Tax=Natronorubrum halalkaliphilum TaxID=2691917 RepID=A0A6B0VGJ1_9EURY|nr:HAD family hydrolase [Natronorubrum halalkaliphilum]MXV60493.1 HAD-IA family hydrolase [Natronorubrum halalkaliphilum]